MKILLTGDSKQSWNLIYSLLDKHHHITVINADMVYCQRLADQYEEITILNGDSTDLSVLEETQVKKFDMVIALSLYDSENLVICEWTYVNNVNTKSLTSASEYQAAS